MKCLIFSDSHGDSFSMIRAMRAHPDAEVIFFLGDGLSDLDSLNLSRDKMVLAVRGNCDFSGVFRGEISKKVEAINLMGYRIVLTHGDLYGAKYGEGGLLKLAEEKLGYEWVNALVESIGGKVGSGTDDGALFLSVRKQIGEALSQEE